MSAATGTGSYPVPSPIYSLTDVESFCFLFKSVWREQRGSECKFKFNLLDVILFHDGTPFRWLFTSRKSGEIMKKKDDKLIDHIFRRSLKDSATLLNNTKSMNSTAPVATVWYAASTAIVKSYLVDERELAKLFECKDYLNNVLAIQLRFSGQSLKGSGVFEHIVQLDVNGRRQYQTMELPNRTSDESSAIMLPCPNQSSVSRAQHSSIKDISRRLVKAIEISARCVVASIVVRVGFDASWTPHIITAKNIVLHDVPSEWHVSRVLRDSMIYPSGIHPKMCDTFSDRPPELLLSDEIFSKERTCKKSKAEEYHFFEGSDSLMEDVVKGVQATSASEPISTRISKTETSSTTSTSDLLSHSTSPMTRYPSSRFAQVHVAEESSTFFPKIVLEAYDGVGVDGAEGVGEGEGFEAVKADNQSVQELFSNSNSEFNLHREAQNYDKEDRSRTNSCERKMITDILRSGLPADTKSNTAPPSGIFRNTGGVIPESWSKVRDSQCSGDYCIAQDGILTNRIDCWSSDTDRKVGREQFKTSSKTSSASFPRLKCRSVAACESPSDSQLLYKSIALDRAEGALIGPIKSLLWDQLLGELKDDDSDCDRLLSAFARGCALRVASSLAGQLKDPNYPEALRQNKDYLQILHNKLVYNPTYALVRASKFHQKVSTCMVCHKLYTMLDFERDEIIMKSSVLHRVTPKHKRGIEARKGKDSITTEEVYHETKEQSTTISDSPLSPKVRMMEKNRGRDSKVMTCISEEQEKFRVKVKEKEKESTDSVSKLKNKASRRLQSLKCSLLSSPTRRKILLRNRNDLLLQFESTQPSLLDADCSLSNIQDPIGTEESILQSVQSTTADDKTPEGFPDPILSIEAVMESSGLDLGLAFDGDLQGISLTPHSCTISVESSAIDLEAVKSSRTSIAHGILRRTKDTKVLSQIQLKSTHRALKSLTESPYRSVQKNKIGNTSQKKDIPQNTEDQVVRQGDKLSLSSVKHEHEHEQMQQGEGVVSKITEGKCRKWQGHVTPLNQRTSASKVPLTKRNKQTSANRQDATPLGPQVLEVHRRSVTENEGDGGEKKEDEIFVGGDGSLAQYFAEQQDFDRNEEGDGSGEENREERVYGEKEEMGEGDVDITRESIRVIEGVDLEEGHRIEMHESIDRVFEKLHQQEYDTVPLEGPCNEAMQNNFIIGGELDVLNDIKGLELHQSTALRTTASSVYSRTIEFPNNEDSANAASHTEETEYVDYAHADNVQGVASPMTACYEGQTVHVNHEEDLNDDQGKQQADYVDDYQDQDGGKNSSIALASGEMNETCTHHSFKRRSNSELSGVMRRESSAYLIAQRDLGLHPDIQRDLGLHPDTQRDLGLHPDTQRDLGLHPDTQRDLGLHPDTESTSSSNLHQGDAS